jgi:hypothetical protein
MIVGAAAELRRSFRDFAAAEISDGRLPHRWGPGAHLWPAPSLIDMAS